ncbi:MAG: hypothetical protein ACLFOY_04400 [Desulfatibacillaceae bacterium]
MTPHANKLYVVGARQRPNAQHLESYRMYEKAVVLDVDLATGKGLTAFEYATPPEFTPGPDRDSHVFKAATVRDGVMYLCTLTEALGRRLPDFAPVFHVSHPYFNDLHHVRPDGEGNLLVVSTGLDAVLRVDRGGNLLDTWYVGEDPMWERFDPDTDYRRVPDTKPHQTHPNYVFFVGRDIWCTRFNQRDAVNLTGEGRLDIAVQRPHDGKVRDGRIHFTTVDGHLVVFDLESGEKQLHDLASLLARDNAAIGWCRGVELLDDGIAVVAFSRIRRTRFRENVAWLRKKLGDREVYGSRPTRLAIYDMKARGIVREMDLEPHGINVVFSIHRHDG